MLSWLLNRFTFGSIDYKPRAKGPFRKPVVDKKLQAKLAAVAPVVADARKSAEAAGIRTPIVSNHSWPGGSRVLDPRKR